MGLRAGPSISPSVSGVIAAETLRQEADISETCSFFVADLTRASTAVQVWKKRLPDVIPFYGERSLNGSYGITGYAKLTSSNEV
jgi:hypothetical protein